MSAPRLSVFDFDGTLSYRDSFLPFLRFALGARLFARLFLLLPHCALLALRLASRDDLKERLVRLTLAGAPLKTVEEKAKAFAARRAASMLRPAAVAAVRGEIEAGREVVICSATPEIVLRPFAEMLGADLVGTRLEAGQDGILTGRLKGANCRGEEKVRRLSERFGDPSGWDLRAWGDSGGDRPMLALAREAHWKPFRG